MCVHLFTGILEPDNYDDYVESTRECQRICNEEALPLSLSSGRYPEYLGIEGPQDRNNPQTCNPMNFLFLLWPESLCDLIVDETNSYGRSKPNWLDIDRDELLTLVGLITMMGIKKLPRIENYWSMSSHKVWQIWSNLHVVDNSTLSGNGLTRKFKPILDVFRRTFLSNYSPLVEVGFPEGLKSVKLTLPVRR